MINKSTLVNKIFTKKNQDYTYIIIFFLVFSFFIFFAIRPSLTTAFSLNKKLEDLKSIDAVYEKQVAKIVSLQGKLEKIRDVSYLTDLALPHSAQVNKVINDIKLSTDKNNLKVGKMDVTDINLRSLINQKKVIPFSVKLEAEGKYGDFLAFINEIKDQRRLKYIKSLIIERPVTETSDSGNLKFNLEIEDYYL